MHRRTHGTRHMGMGMGMHTPLSRPGPIQAPLRCHDEASGSKALGHRLGV